MAICPPLLTPIFTRDFTLVKIRRVKAGCRASVFGNKISRENLEEDPSWEETQEARDEEGCAWIPRCNRGEQTSLFPRYLSTTFLSFGSLHDLCVAHKPFTMSYLTNKSVPAVADRVKREAINMRFNALSFTGTKRFHARSSFPRTRSNFFPIVSKLFRRSFERSFASSIDKFILDFLPPIICSRYRHISNRAEFRITDTVTRGYKRMDNNIGI